MFFLSSKVLSLFILTSVTLSASFATALPFVFEDPHKSFPQCDAAHTIRNDSLSQKILTTGETIAYSDFGTWYASSSSKLVVLKDKTGNLDKTYGKDGCVLMYYTCGQRKAGVLSGCLGGSVNRRVFDSAGKFIFTSYSCFADKTTGNAPKCELRIDRLNSQGRYDKSYGGHLGNYYPTSLDSTYFPARRMSLLIVGASGQVLSLVTGMEGLRDYNYDGSEFVYINPKGQMTQLESSAFNKVVAENEADSKGICYTKNFIFTADKDFIFDVECENPVPKRTYKMSVTGSHLELISREP